MVAAKSIQNCMNSYIDKIDVSISRILLPHVLVTLELVPRFENDASSSSANWPARAKNGDTILFHALHHLALPLHHLHPPKEQIKVLIGERFGVKTFPSPTHFSLGKILDDRTNEVILEDPNIYSLESFKFKTTSSFNSNSKQMTTMRIIPTPKPSPRCIGSEVH